MRSWAASASPGPLDLDSAPGPPAAARADDPAACASAARPAGARSRLTASPSCAGVGSRTSSALDHPGRAPALQRFAAHLRTETPAILSFLFDASLDATNWRAQQALRPPVVNRKVSGGNRSARGAATQQILTSVVRTASQRQLRPSDVLVALLRTPTPTIAPALQ